MRTNAAIPLAAGLCAMTMTSMALAQSEADLQRAQLERLRLETILQASKEIPAGQRAFIDYGAYLTFTYLSVDDSNNENHVLRQYEGIAYSRLNFDNAHEVFVRLRTTYRDFAPGDSFDGEGDDLIGPELDLGYYRFDLARHLGAYSGKEIDGNIVAQVGRDVIFWGNGVALGQVLDGVVFQFSKGAFQLDAIAGVTPERVVDFEASRPDFDEETRRGYYGLLLSAQVETHRPFIYGLIQRDYNDDSTYTLGTVETTFGYDSYYIGAGSSGTLSDHLRYGAEIVYEGGKSKSNSFTIAGPFLTPVEQTEDTIRAMAADFRLDYAVQGPSRTWLSAELLLATGDDDRLHTSNTFAGNRPGTSDRAFNGFSLINTGAAFAPLVSNLIMARVGASSYPFHQYPAFRRMQVGADLFAYGKFSEDAPIDEVTEDGRFLGWEPDLYLNWQITSDVTLALRYGIFFPNDDVIGSDEIRQFFSTSVTIGL